MFRKILNRLSVKMAKTFFDRTWLKTFSEEYALKQKHTVTKINYNNK